MSDDSKENLANGVKAKREAENNRCYGRAVSDPKVIDNELRENAVSGKAEEKTCDCYKPERARPDASVQGLSSEAGREARVRAQDLEGFNLAVAMRGMSSDDEKYEWNYYQQDGQRQRRICCASFRRLQEPARTSADQGGSPRLAGTATRAWQYCLSLKFLEQRAVSLRFD